MGETMQFPETVDEFMQQYKITDSKQIYTNGTELVPIFRMRQWFEAHKQRWIPCTERLPEQDGAYLVADTKIGWIGVKQFSKRKTLTAGWGQQVDSSDVWWELDEDDYPVWCPFITHWQPLPEPPKEE